MNISRKKIKNKGAMTKQVISYNTLCWKNIVEKIVQVPSFSGLIMSDLVRVSLVAVHVVILTLIVKMTYNQHPLLTTNHLE